MLLSVYSPSPLMKLHRQRFRHSVVSALSLYIFFIKQVTTGISAPLDLYQEHPDPYHLSAGLRQETICVLGGDTQPLRPIRSDLTLQVEIFALL